MIEELRQSVRSAFEELIRNRIQEKLNVAFSPSPAAQPERIPPSETSGGDVIVTTDEETQAFYIVQAIASEEIDPKRVTIRDAKTYCSVFVDDNNRKPVCRFYFNGKTVKYLGCFDTNKAEQRHTISTVRDIYQHRNLIREAVRAYA